MKQKVFVIAEAGVNHNGSLELAIELIEAAARAGADAVKFQTFRTELVITTRSPKAEYQIRSTGAAESQFEMVKKLELDEKSHRILIRRCLDLGIQFLSTPFDLVSLEFLTSGLGASVIKIASGEITHGALLLAAARSAKQLIISTGMCTLEEVEQALGVVAFGLSASETTKPSKPEFVNAFNSPAGRAALRHHVTLLHCTTEYPAPFAEVNLRAMNTLSDSFGLPVGYSDHTVGIAIPIAAAALGATVIEKHFTLNRKLPGPDHAASLEPAELEAMVRSIREIESALGSPEKLPTPSEIANRAIARKSLVASRKIHLGELFTEANLIAKRPGTGLTPMDLWSIVGKTADRDYLPDEQINMPSQLLRKPE